MHCHTTHNECFVVDIAPTSWHCPSCYGYDDATLAFYSIALLWFKIDVLGSIFTAFYQCVKPIAQNVRSSTFMSAFKF